ncbi:hypothetical protein F2P45_16155 [Massilia sp. CCM 8733]|uniref:Rhs family protein n=1 Tax=Massilia mucilaginosa TaxID=2609282 RepID=A0ABX0NV48_9BURK|nr:hypothetical protein [Massilia mucilaginosa]
MPHRAGTSWTYDMQGNLAYQQNELNVITRSKFNLFGERTQLIQPISQKDGRFIVTNYAYDKLGQVERSWIDHIPVVKITGITEGDGMNVELVGADQTLTQHFRYDELGRRIASVNSAGGETRTRYDLDGNVVSTTDESGVTMRYAYDSMHRKIFEQDAMGKKNTWHYEGGILVSSTDMGDATTEYGYDGLRHMTYQKGGGKGKDLVYGYDGAGLLTRVEDRTLKQVTTYAYDLAGNRVGERTVVTESLQADSGSDRRRVLHRTRADCRLGRIVVLVRQIHPRRSDLSEHRRATAEDGGRPGTLRVWAEQCRLHQDLVPADLRHDSRCRLAGAADDQAGRRRIARPDRLRRHDCHERRGEVQIGPCRSYRHEPGAVEQRGAPGCRAGQPYGVRPVQPHDARDGRPLRRGLCLRQCKHPARPPFFRSINCPHCDLQLGDRDGKFGTRVIVGGTGCAMAQERPVPARLCREPGLSAAAA